jgi:hypothetical protein
LNVAQVAHHQGRIVNDRGRYEERIKDRWRSTERATTCYDLTYTWRDLPQQLTQCDYLTPALYECMSPAHRFLMDIEPLAEGQQVVRQPKGAESRNWWN